VTADVAARPRRRGLSPTRATPPGSAAPYCLVVELNADRAVMGGMAATYRGVFALDR
jgi:hypothetical protein